MRRKSGEAGFLGDIVKRAVVVVAMKEEGLTISRTGLQRVDLWIHVTIGNKKVQPGIVIHIEESGAPANVRIAGLAHCRGPTHIIEPLGAQVAIERIRLLFKVGNEEAQAP